MGRASSAGSRGRAERAATGAVTACSSAIGRVRPYSRKILANSRASAARSAGTSVGSRSAFTAAAKPGWPASSGREAIGDQAAAGSLAATGSPPTAAAMPSRPSVRGCPGSAR